VSKYILSLIQGNEITFAFLKANAVLLNTHSVTNVTQLIELWKQEYQAELALPDQLLFDTQSDLITFLLKWS
jgi:hypothetical protein